MSWDVPAKCPSVRRLGRAARPPARAGRRRTAAFTLVEMLVATAVTLILVFALSQTFAVIGESVAKGRAAIEISGSLRAVANRLQTDLDGRTCPVRPWIESTSGLGYFEYLEGAQYDLTALSSDSTLGDVDDLLMFTAHSGDTPFVGHVQAGLGGPTLKSTTAEIIWWTELADLDGDGDWDAGEYFTLHRRCLLVRPDLNNSSGVLPVTPTLADDLSWRRNTAGQYIANSLGDLTLRANRFAHGQNFPHLVDRTVGTLPLLSTNYVQTGNATGADLVLSNLLAFDVKAFDPTAAIHQHVGPDGSANTNDDEAVVPGDRGFATTGQTVIGKGAFVDLNYARYAAVSSTFSGQPQTRSQLGSVATYDTWAFDYEHDGANQDGDTDTAGTPIIDEGTNGFDDLEGGVYASGIDDAAERETAPPYAPPLRGVQVRLRVYEPDSRQIRQATVVADFVPE